jgi:Fe-S cluster assembly iron-binding protein IscA
MVRLTDQAASALQELLAESAAPPEAGVRLSPSSGGNLGMNIETPQVGDEVIEREDTPLLIVDSAVAPGLSEMVIDFSDVGDDHQTAGGFVLRPDRPDE